MRDPRKPKPKHTAGRPVADPAVGRLERHIVYLAPGDWDFLARQPAGHPAAALRALIAAARKRTR